MSWPLVTLASIAEIVTGNTPSKADDSFFGGKIPFVTPGELDLGYVDSAKQTLTEKGAKVSRLIPANSVMVCCIGSLGKVGISALPVVTNQQINSLVVNEELASPLYVYYFCKTLKNILNDMAPKTTVAIVNKSRFSALKIPLPPLAIQKQIAAVLEKADQLRKDCQQMEQELNSLAQAVFIDMFGDPVTNPNGWEITSLPAHGTFKNGLNYTKSDNGVKLRYLGVGDFKSLSSIDDVSSLGWIDLNEIPSNDYLLKCGDLVFVRSNGNKALVGRCISVYPKGETLTFSGFCIRYRIEDSLLEPEYLNYLLRTKSMKQALLEGGQGANIQNINQKILSSIKIPLPHKNKQLVFCKVIKSYRESALRLSEYSTELEVLFQSLMQKAFKGELNLTDAPH